MTSKLAGSNARIVTYDRAVPTEGKRPPREPTAKQVAFTRLHLKLVCFEPESQFSGAQCKEGNRHDDWRDERKYKHAGPACLPTHLPAPTVAHHLTGRLCVFAVGSPEDNRYAPPRTVHDAI
jgi:hypothetical protein